MLKANTLILDEPTNHLDLDSKEVLENALIDYPGTILFVSHDRYFINRIATKVIELSGDGAFEYLGDYDYFVEKKKELEEIRLEQAGPKEIGAAATKQSTSTIDKDAKKRERQISRRLEELEAQLQTIEGNISTVEEKLCDPAIFQDHEQLLALQKELEAFKEEQEVLMMEWMELEEELEIL